MPQRLRRRVNVLKDEPSVLFSLYCINEWIEAPDATRSVVSHQQFEYLFFSYSYFIFNDFASILSRYLFWDLLDINVGWVHVILITIAVSGWLVLA